MKNKNSIYNIIAALILQVATFLSGLILPRIIINYYGSEINGLISSIKQIVNYATLIEAGIAGSAIYMLYKPLFDKNQKEINRVVSSAKKFYNKSGTIFLIIMTIVSIIMPFVVNTGELLKYQVLLLVLTLGINAALEFFSMGKYRVLLTADQRGYIISLIQTISIFINIAIVWILSKHQFNIVVVQIVASISYFVRSLMLYLYVRNKYPDVYYGEKDTVLIEQRGDVLLHQIGGMVVFNSPILIITFVNKDLIASSIYSIYHMVFMGLVNLIGVFNTSLVAGMGNIICENDDEKLKNKYNTIEFLIYFISRTIYGIALLCIVPFIKVYTRGFSDANYFNLKLAMLIILAGVIHSLRVPQSMIINAAGHFKKTRIKTIIESCLCITVGIISTIIFGYTGVILGIIISGIYRTIDAVIYVPREFIKDSLKNTLKRVCIYMLNISITIILFMFLMDIDIVGYSGLFIYAILIAAVETSKSILISVVFERKQIKNVYQYINKLLKNKLINREVS